jgi:hypothetical protein
MDYASAGALSRQMNDEMNKDVDENIDIVSKGRGAADGHDYTLKEIASEVGLADSAYPAQNVKKVLIKARKKFIRNYAFMLISDCAMAAGFNEEDAVEFAAQSYLLDIASGKSDTEILRGWMDA